MASLNNIFNSPLATLVIFLPLLLVTLYSIARRQNMKKSAITIIKHAALTDPMWEMATLERTVIDIFRRYNHAKDELDLAICADFLSDNLKTRIELEFAVLKNEHRSIRREGLKVDRPQFFRANQAESSIIVWIGATATTIYQDILKNSEIYRDIAPIYECWKFIKRDNRWLADDIQQSVEACERTGLPIAPKPDFIDGGNSRAAINLIKFANTNHFYFDPDFGREMLPDKGALFGAISFAKAVVSDHVIGKFRDKIVEFYRYEYPINQRTFVIGQAILPREYQHILIQHQQLINWPVKGLNKIETESPDFNNHFTLYAHDVDQANSFELLSPNFIEKVSSQNFKLSIEVIGTYLFLYTENNNASYDQMLEILSWAFDEMKM